MKAMRISALALLVALGGVATVKAQKK